MVDSPSHLPAFPTSVSDESIPDVVDYSRPKQCQKCHDTFTVPPGQSYHQTAICSRVCSETLPCGHTCVGQCGECTSAEALLQQYGLSIFMPEAYVMNVAHHPCMHVCGKRQPCGHLCNVVCCKSCPPCRHACDCPRCVVASGTPNPTAKSCGRDENSKSYLCSECPYRGKCNESCAWRCDHHSCSLQCSTPCQRPVCNRRCGKRLDSCGHRCVGVCGEFCPPFCPACYRGEGGEERKKAQMDLVSKRLYVDGVFVFDDDVEEYGNGNLLKDSENDEEEEVEKVKNMESSLREKGSKNSEKKSLTFSHPPSNSVMPPSDSFLNRPIEMPCCRMLVCVGFLDKTFEAINFSKQEQEEGVGKALQLLACPFCKAVLPYPCEHCWHDTLEVQEGQRKKDAAVNDTIMSLCAPRCIYRYSKLQKEKFALVNKVCEEQQKAWREMRINNTIATRRVVNGLLNPECADYLKKKESKDNDKHVEKLFSKENEQTERVRVFQRKRENIIQSELSSIKENGKVRRNINDDGGLNILRIEEWRDDFFYLVKDMMQILHRAQYCLTQSERNCFLWWVLLGSPENPSTYAVAGALLNLIFATPMNDSPNFQAPPQTAKLFAFFQDTMLDYGHYVLENFFTINETTVQNLSLTMEWLRCILKAFVHSPVTGISHNFLYTPFLAQHRNFFGCLYLPSAEKSTFWDANKIALPKLCEMIAEGKNKISNEIDVDFLRSLVRTLNVSAGHFYSCPNGHVYVVTECGGSMQESTCPECKERIGGMNHRLVSTNYSLAHVIDPSAQAAQNSTNRYL